MAGAGENDGSGDDQSRLRRMEQLVEAITAFLGRARRSGGQRPSPASLSAFLAAASGIDEPRASSAEPDPEENPPAPDADVTPEES